MAGLYSDGLTVGQIVQHAIHRAYDRLNEIAGHCRRTALQRKRP